MDEIRNFKAGKVTNVGISLECDYKNDHYHIWVKSEKPIQTKPIALMDGTICRVYKRGGTRTITSATGIGKFITEELLREARKTEAIEKVIDEYLAEEARKEEEQKQAYIASCKRRAGEQLYEALEAMIDSYWRGSEDSSDKDAPRAVKLALTALKATQPKEEEKED